jgi:hypothetical protein
MPDNNYAEFNRVAADLRKRGFEVVNPAEFETEEGEKYSESWSKAKKKEFMRKAMTRDCAEVCKCDGVYMLEEWNLSTGATAEYAVNRAIGGKVIYQALDKFNPKTPHEYMDKGAAN